MHSTPLESRVDLKRGIELEQTGLTPRKTGLLRVLGPGLITGASDDDPSGIATYSQAGAQFGFNTLWTMVLAYPLMVAVQRISAIIGRVTGHGIAGNMRRHSPRWLLFACVSAMVAANIVNLGADIAAIGAAVQLLCGGSAMLYAAVLTVVSLLLQTFIPYTRYVKILKWLTLALFSYVATVFVVKVPWAEALKRTVVPAITFDSKFLTMLAAIFGTTISPYLMFWQSSEEVEETKIIKEDKPLIKAPEQAPAQLGRIELDTYVGMAFANLVAFFIILTTAVTLNAHGQTEIQTAAQAAEALRPVAGKFAFLLFSLGIVGTGMLALPVLAGSAAYAVGEAFGWRTGLEAKPKRARKFYLVLAATMLAGLALNFVQIDPIKALFWAAVVNGLVAPPIMVTMMLMAGKPAIMQNFVISKRLKIWGWAATILMFAVAAASIASWLAK
jgi:NRAMP (natural resistance-associated macrophage protein)-like metal ion transporter